MFSIPQLIYEFDIIVGIDNSFERFEDNWEPWKHAIIKYSQAYQNKPKMIRQALQELVPGESGKTCMCISLYACIHHEG